MFLRFLTLEKKGYFIPKFFFNGITVKPPFGTFIFKSVDVWMRKPEGWNSLHYAIFVQIVFPVCSLEEVTLIAERCCRFWAVGVDRFHRKSYSVWWKSLSLDSDSIRSEDLKHIWCFELILEQYCFQLCISWQWGTFFCVSLCFQF